MCRVSCYEVMMTVKKPKLRKGLSYVLKTSLLQEALDQARIDCHVDLKYWTPQSGSSVLEAHYWLPNGNVEYPRVYLRAGVVPITERQAALDALRCDILPAFISWLSRIIALPKGSPKLHGDLYFNATYEDGEIGIIHDFRS